MSSVAIVIFCFNRPDSLGTLLDSLLSCREYSRHPVIFYVDGPRNPRDKPAIEATAAIAQAFEHPDKMVVQRVSNLGLKASLTQGITETLDRFDQVIVLEDDLVLGEWALDHFLTGLEKFAPYPQVASICGYAPGSNPEDPDAKAHFLPMTHPWGWATWKDRWLAHVEGPVLPLVTGSRSFRTAMNVYGLRDFHGMLGLAQKKMVSSWWIYWHLNAIHRHAVSLFPKRSHVVNAGIGKAGTHSSRLNFLARAIPEKQMATGPTDFPEAVFVDFSGLDRVVSSKEAKLIRMIGFLGMVKRRLKRMLR